MSGGSYDYLCWKTGSDLLGNYDAQRELDRMIDRLAGLGYAHDAAKESMAILAEVRRAEVRIDTMIERVAHVWKALEWWDSCDTDEDDFKKALSKYRGESEPAPQEQP